jgi:quercetin dioxygenase-like cupin family protein
MNIPQDINQLINYQEASVVSREIVNKQGGTITLFAFDKGQGLSEHRAPYDALVLVTEGTAEISISGKINQVKSGQILLMPANNPHAVKAIERFKMLLTMIKA